MTAPPEPPYHPVEASADIMADLHSKVDDMDTWSFTAYALSLGLTPPDDPPGYQGWHIVPTWPNDHFNDQGILCWWGPTEDHGEEDHHTDWNAD